MTGAAISTSALVKRYGRRRALDGFTLAVPQGAVMGLVGPNGAGKTTWMMCVAGFLRPTDGTIDVLGRGPFNASVHSGRLSILPQDSALPLEANPRALLYRYGRLQGLSAEVSRASTAEVLAAMNLADRADSTIRSLSHGMRKRVMLAQCFIGSPEVVLLDEPLNGLDPAEQSRMRNFILARRGRQTIVVSSHNLNDVEILCTHVAFVENGRVVRMATVRDITSAAGRVVYTLAAAPAEPSALVEALSSALPATAFSWKGETELACDFTAANTDIASVNAALLPVLIGKAGVVSVAAGQSLEQAYLKHDSV